jgi:hypothetical protein
VTRSRKEQEEARIRWKVAEAERLIEARRRVQRPANPITIRTNQHFDPRNVKADPGRAEQDRMAAQVIAALAQRDRGNQR